MDHYFFVSIFLLISNQLLVPALQTIKITCYFLVFQFRSRFKISQVQSGAKTTKNLLPRTGFLPTASAALAPLYEGIIEVITSILKENKVIIGTLFFKLNADMRAKLLQWKDSYENNSIIINLCKKLKFSIKGLPLETFTSNIRPRLILKNNLQ